MKEALSSREAFVLRRAQILLKSAAGKTSSAIAAECSCSRGTVRKAIHDFNDRGLEAL